MQESPLHLLEESGIIKESYSYGPFGEDISHNAGHMQPFTYTGYQKEENNEIYYAKARYYAAGEGRFLSEDIHKGYIEEPNTLNAYAYCFSNPVLYVDMDGELPTVVIGAVVGGVFGFVSSLAGELLDGKEGINWKNIGVDTASSITVGAIAGTGVGIPVLLATGAGVGAGNYVAKTTLNDEWKKRDPMEHLLYGSESVITWMISAAAGGSMKEDVLKISALKAGKAWDRLMLSTAKTRMGRNIWKEIIKFDNFYYKQFLKSITKKAIKGTIFKYRLEGEGNMDYLYLLGFMFLYFAFWTLGRITITFEEQCGFIKCRKISYILYYGQIREAPFYFLIYQGIIQMASLYYIPQFIIKDTSLWEELVRRYGVLCKYTLAICGIFFFVSEMIYRYKHKKK